MAESTREKNEKVIKKQEKLEEKKTVEPVEIDIEQATNKLSKRNTDYLYKLNKDLIAAGKTEEEAKGISEGLIVEIYENQIKGIPATKLYGTPSQKVDSLLNVKKTPVKQPYWKIAVDSSLLFLALFAALYGVLGMTGGKQQGQTGIVTLIGIAVMWGSLLPWFNIQNRKDREHRPGFMKMMGYIIAGLAIMMALLFITSLLPAVINPVLSGVVYLVIAVVAFGARFIFRRQNNITTSALF